MDIAQERAEFAKALADFDSRHTAALSNRSSGLAAAFTAAVARVSNLFVAEAPKVSLNEAFEGAIAGRKILEALVAGTEDPAEISKYRRLQYIITNEFAAIVSRDWQSHSKAYEPLTEAFKGAAQDLERAKARAEQTAQALNLAADVLGSFGKLLSAFG